jgi:hypothetical protein
MELALELRLETEQPTWAELVQESYARASESGGNWDWCLTTVKNMNRDALEALIADGPSAIMDKALSLNEMDRVRLWKFPTTVEGILRFAVSDVLADEGAARAEQDRWDEQHPFPQ